MSVKGLTVVLQDKLSEDEIQALVAAIGRFRGVIEVTPHEAVTKDHFIRRQVSHELREKLLEVLG